MRRGVIAVLVTAGLAGNAVGQTPEPTPTPVPVPVQVPTPADPSPRPDDIQPRRDDSQPTPTPVPVPVEDQISSQPKPPDPKKDLDAAIAGAQEIKKIVVEDNTKTTAATVELISQLEVGDLWTPDMVDVVKARLVSSGLFKDVIVYWTRADGGVKVHILAKDKHSWVIAPAFYNQPTNVGGGVGFGENNLFGQNQKLLLYAQVATGDSFFIGAWVVPSIRGSRLYSQLDTYLKSSRNIEYTAPTSWGVPVGSKDEVIPVRESRIHYYNFGAKLGVEVWRGIKLDTRLRGAKVSYPAEDIKLITDKGATINDIEPGADPNAPPAPGKPGWDISNEWSLTIDRRANWYGIQSGHKYQLVFEHALPSLGSDFIYYLGSLGLYKAIRLFERHNLVLKTNLAIGHNLPFQQELLTGGTSMRGWLNNQFRGDTRAITNVEYSVPLLSIGGFSVRGLAFFDSAYTTFLRTSQNELDGTRHYLRGASPQVRGLDGLKNSIGVGTRFYLRQIVLPLLGLDFGYGLEARDFQIYLAIGLTD